MSGVRFVRDDEGVLYPSTLDELRRLSGPVLSLYHHYGVRRIDGFRYGFEGLVDGHGDEPIALTPQVAGGIHDIGGSVLGSSRGPQVAEAMVDGLERRRIQILFAIGGDGTLRGAHAISAEIRRRGLQISVIAVPKTIDNDISFVQRTFGFETAVTEARRATHAANAEAESARNGIGLVKLMGRDSGFIAAYSVLVDGHVNFCLVPEVPFALERLLFELRQRLERRDHAVVVVAEGAGQDLMSQPRERDASGNLKQHDIGVFLRDAITSHFRERCVPVSLKYIDPSYAIRITSSPTCQWPWLFPNGSASIRRERYGAACLHRPASRTACGERPRGERTARHQPHQDRGHRRAVLARPTRPGSAHRRGCQRVPAQFFAWHTRRAQRRARRRPRHQP
jgi:6-phosphofructokinase 1